MCITIITGAGRGIGAATARRLAASPDQRPGGLVLSYVADRAAVEAVADDVRGHGVEAVIVRADVSVEADVLALFSAADEMGSLGGLVNNAGIVQPSSRLADYSVDRIERLFAVNVIGSFLCAREAVRRMGVSGGDDHTGGSIVNVSSRAATLGSANEYVDYAATKGAIDTMTIGLAGEVGEAGIRVNAVRPGLIDTDIHADSGNRDRPRLLAPSIPLRRPGTADEVASVIAWLLSDEASYVTGALIDIGGGR